MVAVPSAMLSLGTRLPEFSLPNAVDGKAVSPAQFADRQALLMMFICNHCPYVQHVVAEIGRLARDYQPKAVAFIAVNSNDIEAYPADSPENMKRMVREERWGFPFLFDETQEVAKAFKAACTPDFFLFDRDRRLVYRGQLDDSRPGSGVPVTGKDLRVVLDAVLAGRAIPAEQQKASVGCNIKWKRGNEPEYFG